MTALEMQFAALRFSRMTMKDEPLDALDQKLVLAESILLRRAPTYAWSTETTTAALMASKTIPLDTILTPEHLPPSEAGWWWFDRPVCAVQTPGAGTRDIIALLWGTRGDPRSNVMLLAGFVMGDEGVPVTTTSFIWQFGESVREVADRKNPNHTWIERTHSKTSESVLVLSRLLLAGQAWLNQRILCTSSGTVERHRRKQLVREYQAEVSDVKVVELRRRETVSQSSGAHPAHVDWSCRWIVNGHWRNQPYKDARKLIYIMPYVKGPDDRPLRVPKQTVYAVRR